MTMIERVARAIYSEIEGPVNNADFKRQSEQWGLSKALARAAIAAMREPDEGMMRAMYEAMFVDKFDGTQLPMLGAGIEAMIDAALSEGE